MSSLTLQILAYCVNLAAAFSDGGHICDASLSLVTNHPNINPNYAGTPPLCEIPDERNVIIAPGASIPIRIYQDTSFSRKILGWVVYVTNSRLERKGKFTSYPNNANGVLNSTCNTGLTTLTHSVPNGYNEFNAMWQMPLNAEDGEYTFQALVLTSDNNAQLTNQKFYLPRCSSVCLSTPNPKCLIVNKTQLALGQGYLEIYDKNVVISCTSTDTESPCPSNYCDLSVYSGGVQGVCAAVYVPYNWLNSQPTRKCDIYGYTFTVPRANSNFEVVLSGASCGDSPPFSVGVTPTMMQLTNSGGSTFARALPQHNCVTLGCNVNNWKCVHRGYYDNESGGSVEKFNLDATPSQRYFCMTPSASLGECYCDDACTRLKDCCADFHDTCKISLGANVSP